MISSFSNIRSGSPKDSTNNRKCVSDFPASRGLSRRGERPLLVGKFRISFHPDWQFDSGFFNRSIMASTQILVHRWGPEQGLIGAVSQSLVSSVVEATTQGRRKLGLKKIFLLVFRVQHTYVFAAIAIQNKTAFVGNF